MTNRLGVLALACASLALACASDALVSERTQEPDAAAAADAYGAAHDVASQALQPLTIAEFDASWDARAGEWRVDVRPLGPDALRAQSQALFCPLALAGETPDLSASTDLASIAFSPAACGVSGFPYDASGAFCASVELTNASAQTLNDVYVEVTAMNPSTGYAGYAHPFGTGADPAAIPEGALSDVFGLWSYGSLAPSETGSVQWLFMNAGGSFTYRGRIVASFAEVANGEDDDCDSRVDEGLGVYATGEDCVDDIDCASGACGGGVCVGVCGDDTVDEGEECDDGNVMPGDGCSATCEFEGPVCGDGDATSPEVIDAESVTFRWSAVSCVTTPAFQVEAFINGVLVGQKASSTGCVCGNQTDELVVSESTARAVLEDDGSNAFSIRFTGAASVIWAKAIVSPSDDVVEFYEFEANAADDEVDVPCGSISARFNPVFTLTSDADVTGPPECDDGNLDDGDGCDSNCTLTACGNGIQTAGEACDEGTQTASCEAGCTLPTCGDGVLNLLAGEACDDGGTEDDDGCSSTCTLEVCGDGTVHPGETCDDGNLINGDGCSGACQTEACGDGLVLLGSEACDDGNALGGDGCSATCALECGDGTQQGVGSFSSVTLEVLVESCQSGSELVFMIDDHVAVLDEIPFTCDGVEAVRSYALDDATSIALLSSGERRLSLRMGALRFGNAQLNIAWARLVFDGATSVDVYDPNNRDGNTSLFPWVSAEYVSASFYNEACDGGAGCSSDCRAVFCGNGVIESGETCDDGNNANGDGCSSSCAAESCGNGVRESSEQCDDGGTDNGDGCSEHCTVEACGNGALDVGEECDDGNRLGGDGCDDTCATESCGDGVRNVGEGCDDGRNDGGDGCSAACEIETCDPMSDRDGDRLDDCAETNTGLFVSLNDTGTNPDVADSDGDGIDDGDEVLGTLGGLGLPGYGANPNRKTIFLEIDWTNAPQCGFSDYQPATWEVQLTEDMFAFAPVANRDGSLGIDLVIDDGRGAPFTGGNNLGDDDTLDDGLGAEFLAYKASNFDPARQGYFHYAIMTHSQGNGAGGLAEGPGDDFNVTQGCIDASIARMITIAHELGHNLNLFHGGNDSCNYKPNYNSIMSYANWGDDQNCDGVSEGFPNFSTGSRIDIDETAVDEPRGVCGDVPIDFDSDGSIDASTYARDLNSTLGTAAQNAFCGGTQTVLDDHDDWSNLVYSGPRNEADGQLIPRLEVCDHHIPLAP